MELIHRKHGNHLYRTHCGAQSYVLKWFGGPAQAEVQSYALLQKLSVPTLPVYGRARDALLLEDLANSSAWRLAEEADVWRPETGAAVARWYLVLHSAGRKLVVDSAAPGFLRREVDVLTVETIIETGRRLELADDPVWRLAADHIEAIKQAMRSLPETLNYNDFHWTNLALSRSEAPLRAVVFDYHLLGIGLRYSDCRNVIGSLGEWAMTAFWETYGPVDERERLLDEPASVLYALWVASRRSRFPEWAQGCLRKVRSGELEMSLRYALEVI
jgi:hypothetical protein